MNYDHIARDYDISEKSAVTLWYLGYSLVLKLLSPLAHKRVLDYGCGTGVFSRYLNSYGADVIGVDANAEMIHQAKKDTYTHIDFFHIDSANLHFLPENAFDIAVANFVFCEIPSKLEIIRIMDAINRVLKTDGTLLIMNSNWEKSNGKEFVSFKLEYHEKLRSGDPVEVFIKSDPPIQLHDFFWSKSDYVEMLEKSGFAIGNIYEPIARDIQFPLMAEKTNPPYIIIIAKKMKSTFY